jgi:hypothetical protein
MLPLMIRTLWVAAVDDPESPKFGGHWFNPQYTTCIMCIHFKKHYWKRSFSIGEQVQSSEWALW